MSRVPVKQNLEIWKVTYLSVEFLCFFVHLHTDNPLSSEDLNKNLRKKQVEGEKQKKNMSIFGATLCDLGPEDLAGFSSITKAQS